MRLLVLVATAFGLVSGLQNALEPYEGGVWLHSMDHGMTPSSNLTALVGENSPKKEEKIGEDRPKKFLTPYKDVNNGKKCPTYVATCGKTKNCVSVDLVDKLPITKYRTIPHEKIIKVLQQRKDLRSKHLRIRSIQEWYFACGFYTFPLIVMNQLLVAKALDLIGDKKPFVYMPEDHHYHNCAQNKSQLDFWEKWFQPVSSEANWRNISEEDVWEFSQDSIVTMYYDTRTVHAYPYSERDSGDAKWIQHQRELAGLVNTEYLHVNSDLRKESLEYTSGAFGSEETKVMGVHMRGTDKFTSHKIVPETYIAETDLFMKNNPDGKIFLATDDPEYVTTMKNKYGNDKLLTRPVMRAAHNIFYNDSVDKDKKCREVLLDSLVLAQCDSMVKTWSGVSEFAVYFRDSEFGQSPKFDKVVDLQLEGPSQISVLAMTDDEESSKDEEKNNLTACEDMDFIRRNSTYLPPVLRYLKCDQGHESKQIDSQLSFLASDKCDRYSGSAFMNKGHDHIRPKITPHLVELGFGATMHSLVKPMMMAIKNGYCIHDPIGWNKYNCSSWSQLFQSVDTPMSGLDEDSVVEPIQTSYKDSSFCHLVFQGQSRWDWEYKGWKKCSLDYSVETNGVQVLPEPYQKKGLFFTVAHILSFLMRPKAALYKEVREFKEKIGWPKDQPVIALHVRHGDSCLETATQQARKCDSFDTHMESVEKIAKKYGIKHVYIATDSDTIWKGLKKYPQYTFLYDKKEERGGKRNNETVDILLEARRLNGCNEAYNVVKDLALLGEGDAFVGKFTSNIDRIAYVLQYRRAGTFTPYISMDSPWCFDFGVRSGRTNTGMDFYC
ncbi:hypothetical protein AAMO2058_000251600 [Amorphochlora amoebiformis]